MNHLVTNLKLVILGILLVLSLSISAQTTNIAGIINDYTEVTAISCISGGEIEVASAASLSPGDKVLLIQMKGAIIDESGTSSYGDVTDYGASGQYEVQEIQNISGNTIFFTYALENNYDVSGAVQLVRIPEYDTAIVNGTLTAQAWNGTTGGLLIFFANDVVLNANIEVQGLGFRGGVVSSNNGTRNQGGYYYQGGTGNAGYKGEGIAEVIATKETGRGAQATGGGGGNAHNNGGGGGANYGLGGNGGTWSSETFIGIGGKPVTNQITDNRIFLGGGGGGGHQNNSVAGAGSAGGGIVIIQTQNFTGNGNEILAQGIAGIQAPNNDGSGGGGAGGSIILEISNPLTDIILNASGGNGGNNIRNHGAGGGAGGGFIAISSSIGGSVTTDVSGGIAGTSGGAIQATNGNAGLVSTSLSLLTSNTSSGPITEICNNGIDDDCDGFTDCFDSDCSSTSVCLDSDLDGVVDAVDLDDDNDGLLDTVENNGCQVQFSELNWHGAAAANVSATGELLTVSGSAWANAYSDETFNLPLRIIGTVNSAGNGMLGILPTFRTETTSWNDQGYKFQFNGSSGMYVRHGTVNTGWNAPSIVGTQFILDIDENGNMTYSHDGTIVYTATIPVTDYKITLSRGAFQMSDLRIEVSDCNIEFDTDNDGIPNRLDLDSDGDGCNDVIEAGFTDNNDDGRLGPALITFDSQGLVTSGVDGYTGSNASVLNGTCADLDNDGVIDVLDLDDDNDGITDVEESCFVTPEDLTWHGSASANMTNPSNETLAVTGSAWANAYSDQIFSAPFTIEGTVSAAVNGMIGILPTSATETSSWNDGGYKFQFNASNGMYIRHGVINRNWQLPSIVGTSFKLEILASGTMNYYHDGTLIYSGVVPINDYKLTIARGSFTVDNFSIYEPLSTCNDLDSDGVPNVTDLDSDNDGCFDALEGDAPESQIGYTELNPDGSIAGAVDANGVPNTAVGGQGVGSSIDGSVIATECLPDLVSATDNTAEVTEETDLTDTGNVIVDDDGNGVDTASCADFQLIDVNGDPVTGAPTTIVGTYGNLDINPDGSYTYTLDNTNPLVQSLNTGSSVQETFNYTIQPISFTLNSDFELVPGGTDTTTFNEVVADGWIAETLTPDTVDPSITLGGMAFNASPTGGNFTHFAVGQTAGAQNPEKIAYDLTGLTPGVTYSVSWDQTISNGTFAFTFDDAYFRVEVDGNSFNASTMTMPTLGNTAPWSSGLIVFTASASTATLSFEGLLVDGADDRFSHLGLDNVRVQCATGTASADLVITINGTDEPDPCDPVASGNTDTDGDGISDFCDLDDDNDGILDTDENNCNNLGDLNFTNLTVASPSVTEIINNNGADVTFNLTLTNQGPAGFESGPDGYFALGDIYDTVTDASGGDALSVAADVPVTYILSNKINGDYGFDQGDYWRLTASGGFSVIDPDNQLVIISNDGDIINFRPSANILASNATWQISTVDKVQNILIEANGNPWTPARLRFCNDIDTDGDGTPDFLDLDSDNDGCNDVNEAGFTDDNDDGILGPDPVTVDSDGLVTSGSDGYTTPEDADANSIYDFQEVGVAPAITTQPVDRDICLGCSSSFTTTSTNADTFQWQILNSGTWENVIDNAVYTGSNTPNLGLSQVTQTQNGTQYRLLSSSTTYNCETATSNTVILTVSVKSVITNRQRTYRVNKN